MKAYIITNGKEKEVNQKLADVLGIVFVPASARASVSGEYRDQAAIALAGAIPQLGKFERFEIKLEDSENTVITVTNENLVNVLEKVADAYRIMEQARKATEAHENAYRLVRELVKLTPEEKGTRGRKAQSAEARYANLLG